MDETTISRSYPIVGFGISNVDILVSATEDVVSQFVDSPYFGKVDSFYTE
jgi:hypothetical protein